MKFSKRTVVRAPAIASIIAGNASIPSRSSRTSVPPRGGDPARRESSAAADGSVMGGLVLEAGGREARKRDVNSRRRSLLGLRALLARHRSAHDVGADPPNRLGREASGGPADEGMTAPVVVPLQHQTRKHLPADDTRADAVAA